MKKRAKVRVRESAIQSAIVTILALDGWTVTVTDPGYRPGQVLPPGYLPGTADLLCQRPVVGAEDRTLCQVLFIETKAKDGRVSLAQRVWHDSMRERGFRTMILGEDVEADSQEWKRWYEERSGLCRRKLA
jgi:hypothetical protein